MVYGLRQKGKTTFLQVLIKHYSDRGIRVVVFDTMHNHNILKELPHVQVIQPKYGQKKQVMEQVARKVFNEGNLVFVIEEVDQYCTAQLLPDYLDSLINLGGNRNIALIMTSRRMAKVHNDLVGNCDYHFLFQSFLPQDLSYYDDYIGKVAWECKNLPDYHFIYYKLGEEPVFCRPVKPLKLSKKEKGEEFKAPL